MSDPYPSDCPCGSRCDGHAVAAPEDPGLEWDGIEMTQAEWDEMEHQTLHEHYCGGCVCPVCGAGDLVATTEGEDVIGRRHFGPKDCCDGKYGQPHERWCRYWQPAPIGETRYSDRSPREGWEAAWRVHRATR